MLWRRENSLRGSVWIVCIVLCVAGVLAGLSGFLVQRFLHQPRVVLLWSEDGADWVRADRRFVAGLHVDRDTSAGFETDVLIRESFAGAVMRVKALRRVVVSVDGRRLFDSGPDLLDWKTVRLVPLPGLSAGTHALKFEVAGRDGPAMVWASCPALGVRSGDTWRASEDGVSSKPAVPADRLWELPFPPEFTQRISDLQGSGAFLFAVFAAASGLIWQWPALLSYSSRVRWVLLLAWGFLALNNIFKVPAEFGYDIGAHVWFTRYLMTHLRLPPPDSGGQAFQAPLFYILAGGLGRVLLALGVGADSVPTLLRIIPQLCGGLMIELCYRTARVVFPTQCDLQSIATLVGGLLPMNIYMAQALSNEPLAAVLVAGILLISLRLLARSQAIQSPRKLVGLGAVVGCAVLAKVSSVICFPAMFIAILVALRRVRARPRQYISVIAIVLGMSLLISGGYLIRNTLLVGTPLYIAPVFGSAGWWQDPGYRTPQMLYEFGHVFARPIYNGSASIWDSLYGTMWGNSILSGEPHWNYQLMFCGLWLSIVPMLAIVIGSIRSFVPGSNQPKSTRTGLRFATLAIACFIPAILYAYLTFPIYSIGKATYMLGTTPCIGVLAAAGFDAARSNKLARAAVGGAMLCCAVAAYLTYFSPG